MEDFIKSILLLSIAVILSALFMLPAILLQLGRKLYRRESLHEYLYTIAIGIDQLGGSIIFNEPDYTISTMLYVYSEKGNKYARKAMKLLDFIAEKLGDGPKHCKKSHEWEMRIC